jgi:hypothetical protein
MGLCLTIILLLFHDSLEYSFETFDFVRQLSDCHLLHSVLLALKSAVRISVRLLSKFQLFSQPAATSSLSLRLIVILLALLHYLSVSLVSSYALWIFSVLRLLA